MLVYEKQTRKSVFINAREKAPGAATETMYVNATENSSLGWYTYFQACFVRRISVASNAIQTIDTITFKSVGTHQDFH